MQETFILLLRFFLNHFPERETEYRLLGGVKDLLYLSRETVNFSVSMEKNLSDKIQICTVFCRINRLNLVLIYLSAYSITNSHGLIQEYLFFVPKISISAALFRGLCNKIGFSSNTIDVVE